jgi:hypothetical protein
MIKKSYFYLAIFFLCITASTVSVFAGSTDDEMKKYLKDIPFDIEIKVPKFRDANYLPRQSRRRLINAISEAVDMLSFPLVCG